MRRNEFHLSVVLVSLRIFHNKTLAIEINFVSLYPDLASRVAQCPPTGLLHGSLAAVVKGCE